MQDFGLLEDLLRFDPGQRGLAEKLRPGDLRLAAAGLLDADKVTIATGFFIPRAGNIESDGPPGATFLARALERLGKQVTVLCPESGLTALMTCREILGLSYTLRGLRPGLISPSLLDEISPDAFVALEYCGQGHDGFCRNMRGIDMTEHVPILDDVLEEAVRRGLATVAIGDGGNELGCGSAGAQVPSTAPVSIYSRSDAEFVLCSGISNWGAYVLVGALSVLAGEQLLHTADEEMELLVALCRVGVVDGVTGMCEATVDGLDFSMNSKFIADLTSVTEGLMLE
ncbi:MAG TPA: glutamate cyclase domain-containing protein [Bacillota bacterium]|nr:glutamate cyclase domain-containing protein [Bacillota bacterium]